MIITFDLSITALPVIKKNSEIIIRETSGPPDKVSMGYGSIRYPFQYPGILSPSSKAGIIDDIDYQSYWYGEPEARLDVIMTPLFMKDSKLIWIRQVRFKNFGLI